MGEIQASIVVGGDVRAASDAWRDFDFKEEIGRGVGPAGRVEETAGQQYADEEYVRFEDRGDGTILVTLTLEYDEDSAADVSSLRADAEDELARFRESLERRAA